MVLAPAVGPLLCEWLTDSFGWPWIFYINIPVRIAGIFMVAAFAHDPPYLRRGVKQVDWMGIALLAAAKHNLLAMANLMVSRQSAMMAYNDLAWLMGGMLLSVPPVAMLLPSRKKIALKQKRLFNKTKI